MKIDDLVMLIKAGYTKADIEALGIAMGAEPENEPAPESVEPAPEEPKAEPVKDDRITNLETKLDYVINRFNYLAVKDSQQPAQAKTESVDDILASVIKGNDNKR